MFELTILVCAHNESHVLERSLTSLHSAMFDESIAAELVIVDDGSDDGTVDLAIKLSARMPELHMRVLERKSGHGGFGSMVRYGLAHSSGRYCALVAADGSDPVDLIPKMVAELRRGYQLVICSRYSDPRHQTADTLAIGSTRRCTVGLSGFSWGKRSLTRRMAFEPSTGHSCSPWG